MSFKSFPVQTVCMNLAKGVRRLAVSHAKTFRTRMTPRRGFT